MVHATEGDVGRPAQCLRGTWPALGLPHGMGNLRNYSLSITWLRWIVANNRPRKKFKCDADSMFSFLRGVNAHNKALCSNVDDFREIFLSLVWQDGEISNLAYLKAGTISGVEINSSETDIF